MCVMILYIKEAFFLQIDQIVFPMALQRNVLNSIHDGHQGVTKCRARSRSVWWPGLSKDIEYYVNNCSQCAQHRTNHTEPLLQFVLPNRP